MRSRGLSPRMMPEVSPFDEATAQSSDGRFEGPLPLTAENVERVLDQMRPYLIAGSARARPAARHARHAHPLAAPAHLSHASRLTDGGNVALREIDGATVVLELQGACGTCPSSSMTMKMGLERGLLEQIPEIIAVEQVSASGEALTEDSVLEVLEEVKPFLKMVGGDVELLSVEATDLQPSVTIRLTGQTAMLRSVKGEIIQVRAHLPSYPRHGASSPCPCAHGVAEAEGEDAEPRWRDLG